MSMGSDFGACKAAWVWDQLEIALNLGVKFDSDLSLQYQVASMCKSCCLDLQDLRRIQFHSSKAATLANALISSTLDYCNSLYQDLPQGNLRKLQCVPNTMARVITWTNKWSHITLVVNHFTGSQVIFKTVNTPIQAYISILKVTWVICKQYGADKCKIIVEAPFSTTESTSLSPSLTAPFQRIVPNSGTTSLIMSCWQISLNHSKTSWRLISFEKPTQTNTISPGFTGRWMTYLAMSMYMTVWIM